MRRTNIGNLLTSRKVNDKRVRQINWYLAGLAKLHTHDRAEAWSETQVIEWHQRTQIQHSCRHGTRSWWNNWNDCCNAVVSSTHILLLSANYLLLPNPCLSQLFFIKACRCFFLATCHWKWYPTIPCIQWRSKDAWRWLPTAPDYMYFPCL